LAEYLIVGGGIAGAACAEELRSLDAGARIVLTARELDAPYERPPLSKGYLRGDSSREDCLLHPEAWWAEQGIELRPRTSVMKIDAAAGRASLQGGEEIAFDAALIATGAMVRRLRVEGSQFEGIHYLRALGNSDAIRADAAEASSVVLIGGSYIACEVAASLTAMGRKCTLVMQEDLPLSTGFGSTVGRFVGDLLSARGIDWVPADPLARFEGTGERVSAVVTESGRVIEADMVVMGTGAVPDVMLARASGLELGETGGVACSSALETSAPGIFAAGDMCEYDSVVHGRRLRIEHFEVAAGQGRCAAHGMTGDPRPYDDVPYFWSDLADWCTLEYVGPAASWDEEELRGSPDDGAFSVFYKSDGRIVAAFTVGRSADLDEAREAIRREVL
jgi:3-phenylpropionate/trans-cinnamate dioxygenase ferredoxin reductase subunit